MANDITVIRKNRYQDTMGRFYEAALTYRKGSEMFGRPRGYYVSVEPVEHWLDGGFIATRYFGANADALNLLAVEVKRKSKRAEAEASEVFTRAILHYFESRGLVARLISTHEMVDMLERAQR